MSIFGSNKKKDLDTSINPEVEKKYPNEAKQQQELSEIAQTLERCAGELENIYTDTDFWGAVRKNAEINEMLVQDIRDALTKVESSMEITDENKTFKAQVSQRRTLYEDFIDTKNDNKDSSIYIREDEVDIFKNAVYRLGDMFGQKSSAKGLKAEANTLIEEEKLVTFIAKFREALESGNKIMAESCIDVLKYYLTIGFNPINEFDERKAEQRLKYRREFMDENAQGLIEAIEEYYRLLVELRDADADYTHNNNEWKKNSSKIDKLPADVADILRNTEIKNIAKKIKPGSPYRSYINIVLCASTHLASLKVQAYVIETLLGKLSNMQADIYDQVSEMKKAYNDQGKQSDMKSHMERMHRIKERQIQNAKERDEFLKQKEKLNKDVEGLLESTYDQELMNEVASGMRKVTKHIQIEEENKQLLARILEAEAAAKNKSSSIKINISNPENNEENNNNNQQLLDAE